MQKAKKSMTTKTLTYCALLAAMSVVLARFVIPMPNESTRFSIEAVPIYLAGMLFGPLAGGCVGFAADFVGCLFSGYGYNPIFCVPPILYGVAGGIFRFLYRQGVTIPRLALGFLPPVVLGSVLYQSFTLTYMYFDGGFAAGLAYYLTTRSVQFAVTMAIDVIVIYFLFRVRIFERLGVWHPEGKESQ